MKPRIKRAFLDYSSTTPIDKKVLKVMMPYFKNKFGNPAAYYKEGLLAKSALESSRNEIAKITFIDTPGHEAFKSVRSRGHYIFDLFHALRIQIDIMVWQPLYQLITY